MLNKALLIGRLTRDPEMRYTESGTAVTKFGLATNDYYTGSDGEKKENTTFHNIVIWNQGKRTLAETAANFLRKGSLVYLEGRIENRSYEKDGEKKYISEVNVREMQFLEKKGEGDAVGAGTSSNGSSGSEDW